jgi:hypothetical protein
VRIVTLLQRIKFTALVNDRIVSHSKISNLRIEEMAGPSSISLKQLTTSVDQAVKAAVQRHSAKVSNGFTINPGIICGPILDAATDLKVAQQIADEITQQVQKAQAVSLGAKASAVAAPAFQSAVLATRGHVICGFYPFPIPELNLE